MFSAKVTSVNDKVVVPKNFIIEEVLRKDDLNRQFKILMVSTLIISNTMKLST